MYLFGSHGLSIGVFKKSKSAILPLLNVPAELYSAFNQIKLFAEIFSMNFNLDESGISLPSSTSRTTLTQHNIFVTSEFNKRFLTNLFFAKVPGADCIQVVVLRKCVTKLSCIPAELFNVSLMEFCFPDWWKDPSVVTVFENREKPMAKTATLLLGLC